MEVFGVSARCNKMKLPGVSADESFGFGVLFDKDHSSRGSTIIDIFLGQQPLMQLGVSIFVQSFFHVWKNNMGRFCAAWRLTREPTENII